jgi:hypothetical protein
MVLAAMAMPSTAKTVPSAFDKNCNINWAGGGCGEKARDSSDKQAAPRSVRAETPEPPEPPAPPEHECEPKDEKDD